MCICTQPNRTRYKVYDVMHGYHLTILGWFGLNRFLLHGNAGNRRCSIFGTSETGATPNLTSDSNDMIIT